MVIELSIEQGNHADLDEIEQLYNDLHDALTAGINYPGWIKGIYPTREDALTGIEDSTLFVARSDHKITGSIILNHKYENGYDSVTWQYKGDYRSVFVIHTLVVHPNFTKSGIGRQLMYFAERFARQNNIKTIRLDVYENNTPAINLYENCGYQYASSVDLGYSKYGLDLFKLYEKLL